MLISYLVIKWIRYNSLEATWKTEKQATRKSPSTYLIDRLQAYTDKLIGKKRTNLQAAGFISARQVVSMSEIIRKAERCNHLDKRRATAPAPFCWRQVPSRVSMK